MEGAEQVAIWLADHVKDLQSKGFKTELPVDRQFCSVLAGYYCSKQWQPLINQVLDFEVAPKLKQNH